MLRDRLPAGIAEVIKELRNNRRWRKQGRKNHARVAVLLEASKPIRLELGAGGRKLDGWISVDQHHGADIRMNLLEPLPFPDASVSSVYSSHLLEHFDYADLVRLLSECYRVLDAGGEFSAAVPNARIYLDAYHDPESFAPESYGLYEPAFHYHAPIDYVNYIAYMAGHHRYMFDERNLTDILEKTGFQNVRVRDYDPEIDLAERQYESLYVVGFKPIEATG